MCRIAKKQMYFFFLSGLYNGFQLCFYPLVLLIIIGFCRRWPHLINFKLYLFMKHLTR